MPPAFQPAGLPVIPRVVVATASLAAIVLPIGVAILYGVSSLLGALGDGSGAAGVARFALACGILWGLDLVCLVLMLGVNATLAEAPSRRDETDDEASGKLPREE